MVVVVAVAVAVAVATAAAEEEEVPVIVVPGVRLVFPMVALRAVDKEEVTLPPER